MSMRTRALLVASAVAVGAIVTGCSGGDGSSDASGAISFPVLYVKGDSGASQSTRSRSANRRTAR